MEIKTITHNGFKIPIKDYRGNPDACLDFLRDFYEINGIMTVLSLATNEELKTTQKKRLKPVGIYKRGLALYFVLPNGTEHLAVYLGKGKIATLHNYNPAIMPIWKIKKFIRGGYYVGNC